MELNSNKSYIEDLKSVAELPLDWEKLSGRTVLISGATGMIGSFLIDVLMYKNQTDRLGCKIYALGRNKAKLETRFARYLNALDFKYSCSDINQEVKVDEEAIDYILHLASNTHPVEYSTDPIGTIITNVIGTYNLLELAVEKKTSRFVFASSVEIYGENRGDVEQFDEKYCGYINCNTLRAGYPESKRCGESLCQAYIRQKDVDAVILRLPRTFGPTMQMSDSKAIAQFIKKAIAKEDIVLKSEGNQLYSYAYVADVAAGILYGLFNGICGEAYNVADNQCDITLKDLAEFIAQYVGKKVIFELSDEEERVGYSKATVAILDSSKLQHTGWKIKHNIETGVQKTIDILQCTKDRI